MKKPLIVLSTGIAGIENQPKKMVNLYSDCLPLLEKVGQPQLFFEPIALKHSFHWFIDQASELNYQIVGWHGPVGPGIHRDFTSKIKTSLINSGLINLEQLLELGKPPFDGYLLIHQPVVEKENNLKLLIANRKNIHLLLIENVCLNGSLIKTLTSVADLTKKGVKAGVMIDLVHLLYEFDNYHRQMTKKEFIPLWYEVLEKVKRAINQAQIIGFHLPIGTDSDSLPMILMADNLWKALGKIFKENQEKIKYLTLENTHGKIKFFLGQGDLARLKIRNYQIIDRLIKTGVLF